MTSANAPARVRLDFRRPPAAWRYMLGAFWPSHGVRAGRFPDISAQWGPWRASPRDAHDFLRLCGLPAAAGQMPWLLPHAIGFRLQMAVLTHPAFPLPIWRVLQVRNQLLQLRPIGLDEPLDFECCIHSHRVLDKGLEVELQTGIRADGLLACQSLNTFYVRGRFGAASAPAAGAEAPRVGGDPLATWHLPGGGGWRFGELTGDYNGIHLWDAYARRFGFKRAFFHPLRALAQGLARLPPSQQPASHRLDAWLKGPVYQDSDVQLKGRAQGSGSALALHLAGDPRPAIVAHWRPGMADRGRGVA